MLNEQQASPFSLSPTQPPPHGQGHALCPVCPQRQSLPRHRTHRRARASNAAGKSGAQTLKCPWSIIFCIVLSGLPWWSATRSARLAAVNDLAACGTAGRTTIPCEGRCCALRRTRSVAIQKFAPGAARTRAARRGHLHASARGHGGAARQCAWQCHARLSHDPLRSLVNFALTLRAALERRERARESGRGRLLSTPGSTGTCRLWMTWRTAALLAVAIARILLASIPLLFIHTKDTAEFWGCKKL